MLNEETIMKGRNTCAIVVVLVLPALLQANLIRNPSMEGDFREGDFDNDVADCWQCWGPGLFLEGARAHSGSKSQLILWWGYGEEEFGPTGLYQQLVGLQPGYDYSVSVWLKYGFQTWAWDSSCTFICSVGVDPTGGTDPGDVAYWDWASVEEYTTSSDYEGPWVNITTTFTPDASVATIFIKVAGWGRAHMGGDDPFGPPPEDIDWETFFYIDDVVVEGDMPDAFVKATSKLTVTIFPQEAVDAGAQWRVHGRDWLDSGDVDPDLAPGYHEVEFKPLVLWEEPTTLRVRLVSDCETTATTAYERLKDFSIGEISPQTVWHAQTLELLIHSDELGPSASLSFVADPEPRGAMSLEPISGTGLFTYTPDPQDKQPFNVTFTAELDATSVEQTVEVSPMPHLPPEANAIGLPPPPGRQVPDAADKDSRDYLIVNTVYSDHPEWLNHAKRWDETKSRGPRTISISGKTVVFEEGHDNGLYEYNDKEDIEEMNVYGEKVIMRSPLNLPQANVTIYAKELCFEGQGCINTTPRPHSVDRLAYIPGEPPKDGADGLPAGSITVHIESLDPGTAYYRRFIMQGGDGQLGSNGEDGKHGEDKECFFRGFSDAQGHWYENPWPGHVTKADIGGWDFFPWHEGWNYHHWKEYDFRPEHGNNAIADGKPGDGGDGGDIRSNLILRTVLEEPIFDAIVDNPGGWAGQGKSYSGGEPGEPRPAIRAKLVSLYPGWGWEWRKQEEFTSQPGKDAPAPDPGTPGQDGAACLVGSPLSWLHPYALKMIIAHAKDAYLYGHLDYVKETLQEYVELLDVYKATPWWGDVPLKQQFEFEQMYDEMAMLLHRIDNNLDYFGNPAGWVPRLSFEANKAAFETEIDHAIRVFYLAYWVGREWEDIQGTVNALDMGRKELKYEIEEFKDKYAQTVELIPDLEQESINISKEVQRLQFELQGVEKHLWVCAELNVEKRHELPRWKAMARAGGWICKVTPVGQPYLGAVGMGLDYISKHDPDTDWDIIRHSPDLYKEFNESHFSDKAEELMEALDAVDPDNIDSFFTYLGDLAKAGDLLHRRLQSTNDLFKDTQVPQSELDTEFERVKASDPLFKELSQDIDRLQDQKREFTRRLAAAIQDVSTLPNGITHNLLAIDGINRKLADRNAVLDPRAQMYVKEMERRAIERLRKYHYYMAKAYEYRMLDPYPGDLNVQNMFDACLQIVKQPSDPCTTNGNLGTEDYDALKVIYTSQLKEIADKILDDFNKEDSLWEARTDAGFSLVPAELGKLNAGEPLVINLMERPLFNRWEKNVRIIDIQVKDIDVTLEGPFWSSALLDLYIKHSGLSKLQNPKNGKVYQFRHYTSDKNKKNPLTWGTKYDGYDRTRYPIEGVSPNTESLLYSVLDEKLPDQDVLLFSRPSAWADLVITRVVTTGNNIDMTINSLHLLITYDFIPWQSDQAGLQVLVSEDGLKPYFIADRQDDNGRQDGRGNFTRVYQENDVVILEAPQTYGSWEFDRWTDWSGKDLEPDPVNPTHLFILDEDKTARARYVGGVILISGYIQTPEGVGLIGVTVSADSNDTSLLATTDDDGSYSLTVPRNWSGTVTPSKPGYTFSPPDSSYSNITSNQTGQDYVGAGLPALAAPTGVSASKATYACKVHVSWEAVAGASHYRVYRSTSPEGTRTRLGNWQSGTSYDDTTPIRGCTYLYWVRSATSSGGDQASDYSWPDSGSLSDELLADLSGDYRVNAEDLGEFAPHWLETGCGEQNNSCGGADLAPQIPDGVVDALDLAALAESWLQDL